MKKYITSCIVSCLVLLLLSTGGFGQKRQKLAQTGMKFLSVSTDARPSALGDASTTFTGNSSAMFYNPAGMASMTNFSDVSMGKVNWIADISYVFGSIAVSPFAGRYGVLGLSVLSVDYGDIKGTIRDPGDAGFIDTGLFSPSAVAIGLGYAKSLSTKFAVGANIKFVKQDLGSSIVGFDAEDTYKEKKYAEDVIAFDFGIIYNTGFKSLDFGMYIRNFSQEIEYEDEGFQLPLTFKVGISMNLLDFMPQFNSEIHSLLFVADAVHPRDYAEQVNFGAEYLFMKTFALRAGYSTPNDEHGVSAGVGFQQSLSNYKLSLDYAYTPFGLFDDVHRFSVHFSF